MSHYLAQSPQLVQKSRPMNLTKDIMAHHPGSDPTTETAQVLVITALRHGSNPTMGKDQDLAIMALLHGLIPTTKMGIVVLLKNILAVLGLDLS